MTDDQDPNRGYAMGLGRPTTPIPEGLPQDPTYWYTRLTIAWEHQDHDGRLILKMVKDIADLTEQIQKIRRLHKETDGRCQECVEYCDCAEKSEHYDIIGQLVNQCPHGNVPYPCPTIQQLGDTTE